MIFKCHAITDGMDKELMTGQEETGEIGISFTLTSYILCITSSAYCSFGIIMIYFDCQDIGLGRWFLQFCCFISS